MYNDELYHFGRSKEDGAPGPGTGNYPRHGGGSYKETGYEKIKRAVGNASAARAAYKVRRKKKQEEARKATIEKEKNRLESLKNKVKQEELINAQQKEMMKIRSLTEQRSKQVVNDRLSRRDDPNLSNRWEKYSDESLRDYAQRRKLEEEADRARISKLGAPLQYAGLALSYLQTAKNAMDLYTGFKNSYKAMLPKESTQTQIYATKYLNDLRGKKFSEIDYDQITKDMNKLTVLSALDNAKAGKPFTVQQKEEDKGYGMSMAYGKEFLNGMKDVKLDDLPSQFDKMDKFLQNVGKVRQVEDIASGRQNNGEGQGKKGKKGK